MITQSTTQSKTLEQLKQFQRASVEHAFRRLYLDSDSTRRFLIADETGLGKTMVAKGLIAKTIEHLKDDDRVKRIDIVYVCSNADIADQNLRKLREAVSTSGSAKGTVSQSATRLTELVAQPKLLASSTPDGQKPVTFVSFTPATSFDFGWQTGKARERALLYLLVEEFLERQGYRGKEHALTLIFRGTATKSFPESLAFLRQESKRKPNNFWEPSIKQSFLDALSTWPDFERLKALIDHAYRRSRFDPEHENEARFVTGQLRRLLAQASVSALEPDLVILDEFQRFKHLLGGTQRDEITDLADRLFSQPDARVVLLSATPYKPFTLAEEKADGEDHYQDLFQTLEFLAGRDHAPAMVGAVKEGLRAYRTEALSGAVKPETRETLQKRFLKLLSRIERSSSSPELTRGEAPDVKGDDIVGYVALRDLASAAKAPMGVEYWKSAPYFVNFLSGYKVGEKLRDALKDPARAPLLEQKIEKTQRIRKDQIEKGETIEWGNARLRQLASETVDASWWQLLWMPPSLPYHALGGPFANVAEKGLTKRLVFSSWVAAPSAIAALLSYNVRRQLAPKGDGHAQRLRYFLRRDTENDVADPGAMTTLALFWPMPGLADATDPLKFAQAHPDEIGSLEDLQGWCNENVRALGIENGSPHAGASAEWYWRASLKHDADAVPTNVEDIVDALSGTDAPDDKTEQQEPTEGKEDLRAHVRKAREAVGGTAPDTPLPTDLVEVLGLLGAASPANVAWRALGRFIGPSSAVTPQGRWKAAAVLASAFRTLFNRPESGGLLKHLEHTGEAIRPDDDPYWMRVLLYCRDGNLQAVVDEYLHHLRDSQGISVEEDAHLLELAERAHAAIGLRGITYSVVNPDAMDDPIRFPGRFALRYGGLQQTQDDLRLSDVRAAFNSPFWPFVLATTSVGQEGIDFHWWCHAIVHWNLPLNPVDFEQREGRVNRYKGHAIRRNVAKRHRAEALKNMKDEADVWEALFDEAANEARRNNLSDKDMVPFWQYPHASEAGEDDAQIERSVMGFPMSRDLPAWQRLKDLAALYRLAYGQPRQESMIDLLKRRGVTADEAESIQLRLTPPEAP